VPSASLARGLGCRLMALGLVGAVAGALLVGQRAPDGGEARVEPSGVAAAPPIAPAANTAGVQKARPRDEERRGAEPVALKAPREKSIRSR
jgi:hypothetical protein